jgi:hypothetical protein
MWLGTTAVRQCGFVLRSRTFVDVRKNLKMRMCVWGEVIKQVFFKLMQPQYFSIALLLFSVINPTMKSFYAR